ncbi:MAG: hypothetical protein POG74_12710 [Acidocella sp.]|nr:hypothetical protein [Acidocella sp.]
MFKITKTDSYVWPVSLQMPANGGKFTTHTFDVKFKRLSKADVDVLRGQLFQDDADAAAVVRGLVVGWSGIEDDAGEIPFSENALDNVLDIQGVAPAIIVAFFNSVTGAPRKN